MPKPPLIGAPLTPLMVAALDVLAAHGSNVLCRSTNQWWRAEHDQGFQPWHGEELMPDRFVRTATVKALVARGLMKFIGTKRQAPGKRKGVREWWVVELTPLATTTRERCEDRAQEAAAAVLAAMRTKA